MCKIKYLSDKVIKKALAKDHPAIRNYVARLISDITSIPYEVLEDKLELVYPEVSVNEGIVNSEVDLVFKNEKVYFNIEVNYGRSSTLKNKNFTYTLQLSLREIKNAKEYNKIKKVYQININAYDSYGYGELVYESTMMEKKYRVVYNDLITIYDINLEYFEKIPYNEIERDRLLKDLALFVIEDEEVLKRLYEGDEVMEATKKEMDDYLKAIDSILFYDPEDLQRQIEEEMREEGFNSGFNDGFNDGFNNGEMKSKREIAKKMLDLGMNTIEQIAECTSLTIEEIEKLQENQN